MNLNTFSFYDLLYPFSVVLTVSFVSTMWVTRSVLISLLCSIIKAGLFFVTYLWFFTGQVTGADDIQYIRIAIQIGQQNYTFLDLISNTENIQDIAESSHILYPIFNYFSMMVFGAQYFAAPAINILITVPIAYLGMKLAVAEFGFSRRNGQIFFLLLMLHPEILAWSTVFNGKEVLILLGHTLLLIGIAQIFRGNFISGVGIIIPTLLFVILVRFYVPALIGVALALYLVIHEKIFNVKKYLAFIVVIIVAIIYYYFDYYSQASNLILSTLSNPIIGLPHYLLTPIPFNFDPEYIFLFFPSLYHWLLFPFSLIGFWTICRLNTKFGKFFIIYFMTFVLFYAWFEGLRGPRHRLQLQIAIALFEYIGVVIFLTKYALAKRVPESQLA